VKENKKGAVMGDSISILLVLEERNIDEENSPRWYNCITQLENFAKNSIGIQRLGENVLLLPLNEGLQGISRVLRALEGLKCKYAILSEEIKWHDAEVL
jgi:hypothetical protein